MRTTRLLWCSQGTAGRRLEANLPQADANQIPGGRLGGLRALLLGAAAVKSRPWAQPEPHCSCAVTISMPRQVPCWSRPGPPDLISWPDLRTFSSLGVAWWPGQGHQIFPTCLAQVQRDWALGEATASSGSHVTVPSFWLPLREQPAFAAPSQISSEPFSIQIFTSAEIALGYYRLRDKRIQTALSFFIIVLNYFI